MFLYFYIFRKIYVNDITTYFYCLLDFDLYQIFINKTEKNWKKTYNNFICYIIHTNMYLGSM